MRNGIFFKARDDEEPGDTREGTPIEVVSSAEAEEAECVICAYDRPENQHYPDNVHTTCNDCGEYIIHRPTAPKKPAKICMACVLVRTRGGRA